MAELVAGVGMSHSSLITTEDADLWRRHEQVDRTNPYLRDRTGAPVTFDELERRNGSRYRAEASYDHLDRQAKATRRALDRLKADLAELAPDVFVVVGDDQLELGRQQQRSRPRPPPQPRLGSRRRPRRAAAGSTRSR